MKLSENQLTELLNSSSPSEVQDEVGIRTAVARAVTNYPAHASRRRRAVAAGSIVGGLVLAGTTAAALPSIFDWLGHVDYQSSQHYTVDGRGPYLCEFGFRVDPPIGGVTLEPSNGIDPAGFEEIHQFVLRHDWNFDDNPVALTTPPGTERGPISVMSDFIGTSWKAELEAAYPGWMTSVGGVSETGQCLSIVGGSAQ
jgi:hypothetical protein